MRSPPSAATKRSSASFREFELSLILSTELDRSGGRDSGGSVEESYLVLEPGSAGYVVLESSRIALRPGPVLRTAKVSPKNIRSHHRGVTVSSPELLLEFHQGRLAGLGVSTSLPCFHERSFPHDE